MSQNDDLVLKNWLAAQGFDRDTHENLLSSIKQNLSAIELQQAIQQIGREQSESPSQESTGTKPRHVDEGVQPSTPKTEPGAQSGLSVQQKNVERQHNLILKKGSETLLDNVPVTAAMELFEPPKSKAIPPQYVAPLASLSVSYATSGGIPEELGVLRGPNWKECQQSTGSKGPSQ